MGYEPILVMMIEAKGNKQEDGSYAAGHHIDLKTFWADEQGNPIPGPVASGELIAILESVRNSIIARITSMPPKPPNLVQAVPAMPNLKSH